MSAGLADHIWPITEWMSYPTRKASLMIGVNSANYISGEIIKPDLRVNSSSSNTTRSAANETCCGKPVILDEQQQNIQIANQAEKPLAYNDIIFPSLSADDDINPIRGVLGVLIRKLTRLLSGESEKNTCANPP